MFELAHSIPSFPQIINEKGEIFHNSLFAGIAGLSFSELTSDGSSSFIDTLKDQKKLGDNVFSFFFSSNPQFDGIFTLGKIDNDFFEGVRYFILFSL